MNERLRYTVGDDGVARITLARPEKRNAIDPELIADLKEALAAAEEDDRVRVILLDAEGKDFCAGADLAHIEAMVDADHDALVEDALQLGELLLHMRELPKPIVAAVQGNALAGGAGLANACDIVVAADNAHFGYPEVHIGFVPAMVMTMLVRNIGEKRAFELVAEGQRIDAEEARAIGLVNHVFSHHTFPTASLAYAAELARRPASSIAFSKKLLYELDELSFRGGIERGAEVNAEARRTEACKEGVKAFLERNRGRRG